MSKGACPSSVPLQCLHVPLPTLLLAALFLGHDVLQLMFSAHRMAWDQSTPRPLGSAVRWFGRTVGKESRGVSISSVWLELHPIHSSLSRGKSWPCEATWNCWITTRRHKQSVYSHQEFGEASRKQERGGWSRDKSTLVLISILLPTVTNFMRGRVQDGLSSWVIRKDPQG